MKVTKQETLYHKDHGDTLKHKCGKKDSSIDPFFWGLPFFSLFIFSYLGQCSINDDHHTSIYLQLNDYNSILEQGATLKHKCGKRDSNIALFIFIFFIFPFFGSFFFSFFWEQCSNNDDHHTSIYLQLMSCKKNKSVMIIIFF